MTPKYTYTVTQTASGQWRFAVYEDGEEVQGGAGYETQEAADYDGFMAMKEWDYRSD